MLNDIRIYNYYEDDSLKTRMKQAEEYFNKMFSSIHCDEVDLTEITTEIEGINTKLDEINENIENIDLDGGISQQITESKEEIINAIEDSKPCLCNLATKEDVCKAKCAVINKLEEDKKDIIKEIDDKFVDLNELIKG